MDGFYIHMVICFHFKQCYFLLLILFLNTKDLQMGSETSKVLPPVELYMEVDKPYYNAGENVKGIAYLIAKNNIQYHTLDIRL